MENQTARTPCGFPSLLYHPPNRLYLPLVIQFSHVFKSYPKGGFALKDASLHVAKGEFVFLTGHSGAGKSTMLKLMYAEQRPSSGEVKVSGFSIADLGSVEVPKLRRRLGIVFQDFRLLDDRTAEENVAFALEVTGARRDVIPARVQRVLSRSASPARRTHDPMSSPVASSSGSRLPGHW